MKSAILAILLIILIGQNTTVLSQESSPETNAQFSVDAYNNISSGMTRAEIRNRLGDPSSVKENSLPEGPFWGPQEGIDVSALDGLRRYEEWQYQEKDLIYLIWFGDPVSGKSDWRVIGKTSYPKGAVF